MDEPRTPKLEWLTAAVDQLSESERLTFLERIRTGTSDAPTLDSSPGARPAGGAATRVFEDEDRAGAVIGRYKLLERIGEGGFGSVFVAEQSEPVRRRVALKILKRGMDTQRVVARFEAERQALAMMEHPNIAKVLDAGQTPSGRPFFAMELVRGQPITAFCDAARLAIPRRVELLRAVCTAVQHAHQKGIIHRDLKPSNVLVTLQDGEPVPKVIDFGIAKAIHAPLAEETVYTQAHQMLGTPIYMSPEQTGVGAIDVDTRTDIYSLGALFYEVLAGATPFDQERLGTMSLADMQRMIVDEEPPRPSARFLALGPARERIAADRAADPKRLERLLRGDLDWIVMKCLEKDRARRYESASALEDDLARHLALEPVRAGPPSAAYLAKKFIRRNRAQVAAGSLILTLLVLGLGGTIYAWSRARDQSARLGFTLDFFTRALAGAADDSSTVAVWNDQPELTLGQALRSAEGLIDETFTGQPRLEAVIRELIGLAQLRGGQFDEASRELAQAVAIRSRAAGESDPDTLRLLLPLAEAQSKAGDYDGSMKTARRAYDLGAVAEGPDATETRAAALWLARWFAAGYHFDDAERYFGLATRQIEGVADTRDPITIAATIEGCSVLVSKGKLDRAEQVLRTAAPRIAELPESLATVKARFDRQLGMVLVLRGKYDDAIQLLDSGAQGRVSAAPDADRVRARLLAWALGRAGRAEESIALFTSILTLEQRAPGPAFRAIFARVYYADVLLDLGRPAEALAQVGPALQQYDSLGLPNDPDRLWAQSILGRALLDSGDTAGAGRAITQALQTESLFPEHRIYLPGIKLTHAMWLRATGDESGAAAELENAAQLGATIYGEDHPLVHRIREAMH
ncbi:MAG: protein kinase [Phycisphaerales bacterium]|nr:protein kinase [Phycisphaerales bacterium]